MIHWTFSAHFSSFGRTDRHRKKDDHAMALRNEHIPVYVWCLSFEQMFYFIFRAVFLLYLMVWNRCLFLICVMFRLSLSLTLCGLALVSPRIDAKDAKQVCAFIFGFYCSRIFVDMKRILFAQCECERKSTRVSISWTGHISCRAYNTHTHEHACIDRFGFMHSSKSNATNLGLKWVYSSFIVFGS